MAAGQQWLFAPARPLVERLGRQFFREVPVQSGVYMMRDAAGEVVYVGKAKNLRQRLGSYRVANTERLSRRHVKLMREAARIDFDLCRNEAAALTREAKLLRELKPRFNRAGVWPRKTQFLVWRFAGQGVQFSLGEVPPLGWERFGPLDGYAPRLLGAVLRLLWLSLNPQAGFSRLPCGWAQNRFPLPLTLACGKRQAQVQRALENLCWGDPLGFPAGPSSSQPVLPAFERAAVQADLEEIEDFVTRHRSGKGETSQLALL